VGDFPRTTTARAKALVMIPIRLKGVASSSVGEAVVAAAADAERLGM
jgi:hypothetical protein